MSDFSKRKSSFRRLTDRLAVVCVIFGLLILIVTLFPPAVETHGRGGDRIFCNIHLNQIGLALLEYNAKYSSLPPAFVRGPDGQPWHSWRVLILPFMDQQQLFDEYRFDEPWNGPHNRKLLTRRPEAFQCDHAKGKISASDTTYLAVVGSETAWPAPEAIEIEDLHGEWSNVILVVEVRDAGVPWLAPVDLTFEEACVVPSDKPGKRPSSFHIGNADIGGAHVLLGDGSVRFISKYIQSSKNIDASTWKGLLTRDGGETLGDF